MANFVFDYNIEKTIAAFEIDNSLKNLLLINNLYIADDGLNKNPERISLYKNVANLLLTNGETIYNTSIDKLYSNSFLINELNVIFEKYTNEVSPVNEDVYKGILYSFKHAITKTFFQDNFTNFLPSLDADTIENSEKRNLFIKSIMHEYDKFSDKISEISNITNIDKADNETLEYLSGLLGFSREENDKISISLFRGIAKNILEVYKIKGTAYSVEVFFNLLGFTIDVIEFWFDKRYYSDEIYSNPITGVVSRTSFLRYVSDKKPSLYIPEDDNGNKNFPIIQDSQITSIRDRNYFDKTINEASNKIEALEKMLGENGGIPDQDLDYTYFKTNLVYYNVQRFQKTNSESSLTFDDKIIVENYIKFLTPIFMNSLLVFEVIITDGNEENSGIDASNIFINDTNNITLNNNKIGHSFYTEFNKQERESHVFNYLFSEEFLNNFQEETNDLLGESDNLNNNENNFKNSMDTIVDHETLNGDETFANDSDALGALPWLYYNSIDILLENKSFYYNRIGFINFNSNIIFKVNYSYETTGTISITENNEYFLINSLFYETTGTISITEDNIIKVNYNYDYETTGTISITEDNIIKVNYNYDYETTGTISITEDNNYYVMISNVEYETTGIISIIGSNYYYSGDIIGEIW